MFRKGDYVTGDRSFRVNIYEVVKLYPAVSFLANKYQLLDLRVVLFDGRFGSKLDILNARPASDFRLATNEEVFREMGKARKISLFLFVGKLIDY